jgi:hypothetical protein
MKEFENFNNYESFIEEPLDPSIRPDIVEEVDAIPVYKLGQGKVIFIKAEDFQNTFYLIPLTIKIRIFRKPNQYQYHYVKELQEIFRLRDLILMNSIERTILPGPRMCRIIWFDLAQNARRTVIVPNNDLMDFPHMVQNLPIYMNTNQVYSSEFPLFPEAEDKNFGDDES